MAAFAYGAQRWSFAAIALMALVGQSGVATAQGQPIVESIKIRIGDAQTPQQNITVNEIAQTATVVLTLRDPIPAGQQRAFTLNVSGTASLGSDFTLPGDRGLRFDLTVEGGNKTGTATIDLLADAVDEPNETLTIAFSPTRSATITITDDDDRPAIESLTASPDQVTEDTTTVTVRLKLEQEVSEVAQTYPLTFTGTADGSNDYTAATPRQITIGPGQDTGTYKFSINDDNVHEDSEEIVISTSGDDKVATETVTIIDNDKPSVESLKFRISPTGTPSVQQAEVEGVHTATAILTLDANAGIDTKFRLTVGGTADDGTDFTTTTPAVITVRAGEKTGTLTFNLLEDDVDELDETLTVSTGTGTSKKTARITIRDDDAPSIESLVAVPDSLTEGNTTVTVTMTLARKTIAEEIYLLRLSGSATPATDFNGPSNNAQLVTLNVPKDRTTHKFEVQIVEDSIQEPAETIIASVSSAGINGNDPATEETITILDDDRPAPQTLSANPRDPNEGNTTVTLTLTLDEATIEDQNYSITFDRAGTAEINKDFTAPGDHKITVKAKAKTGTYKLNILEDEIDEGNETIIVKAGSGADTATETITIRDDDTLNVAAIDATPAEVTENGEVVDVVVRFGIKAADQRVLPVTYTGSATRVDDFTGAPTQITVPPGAPTVRFQLRTRPDNVIEGNETVTIGVLTKTATVTILDLDQETAALDEVRQRAGAALLRRNAKRFAFVTNNVVTKRLSNQSANALSSDGRQAFVDVGATVSSVAASLRPGQTGRSGGNVNDRVTNAWVSVEATRLNGDVEGDVFDIHFGADYKIGQDMLIGVVASYEQADVSTDVHDGGLKADGWSLGAYAGVQLLPELIWDIAGSYGRQSPDVYARAGTQSFFGSYDSNRLLVASHLTGRLDAGDGVVIKPTVGLLYGREEQGTLTASRGGTARGHVLELGRVSAGPGFDVAPSLPTGWGSMNITFSAVGQYDFLVPEADIPGAKKDRLSAAAALGLAWTDEDGMSIGIDGSIDGIGLQGYDTYNVSGTLKFDF